MSGQSEPLVAWLKWQRRTIDLQDTMMTWKFDVDGALANHQLEVAWYARQQLIVVAVELALQLRRLAAAATSTDERLLTSMRALHEINPPAVAAVADLLLRPMPATLDEIAADLPDSLRTVDDHLRVGVSATREEMVRGWATSIKLLRDLATGLGLAGTDDWYLRETDGPGAGLDWYDQVLAAIS